MVGDAVEERAGEAFAGEDRSPFLEGQVGGDDGGAVLVASAEDVEEQFASALRERHVSELVDDEQADPGELVLEPEQPLLVARLDHLVDQLGGGRRPSPTRSGPEGPDSRALTPPRRKHLVGAAGYAARSCYRSASQCQGRSSCRRYGICQKWVRTCRIM